MIETDVVVLGLGASGDTQRAKGRAGLAMVASSATWSAGVPVLGCTPLKHLLIMPPRPARAGPRALADPAGQPRLERPHAARPWKRSGVRLVRNHGRLDSPAGSG